MLIFLWCYYPVVDADIVDQAAPEGFQFEIFPCADVTTDFIDQLADSGNTGGYGDLRERHVLAVSGTHGKTTTASLLAWVLEANGKAPGFLIGGVPGDFGVSARLGGGVLVDRLA